MEKAYASRINWQNEPSVNTPINEDNLNKMDKALDDIDDRVVSINSAIQTMGTQISLNLVGSTLYITTTSAIDNAETTQY